MTRPADELMPYKIEVESDACKECGHGKTYTIIQPNGIAIGQSFSDREDAEEFMDNLVHAYELGQQSHPSPSEATRASRLSAPSVQGDLRRIEKLRAGIKLTCDQFEFLTPEQATEIATGFFDDAVKASTPSLPDARNAALEEVENAISEIFEQENAQAQLEGLEPRGNPMRKEFFNGCRNAALRCLNAIRALKSPTVTEGEKL